MILSRRGRVAASGVAALLVWTPCATANSYTNEWAPSLRLGVLGGYDSNPWGSTLTGPGGESVLFIAPSLEADARFVTTLYHVNGAKPRLEADEQFLQLDFGVSLDPVFQDSAKEIEPFVYSSWISFDADVYPYKAKAKEAGSGIQRFSVGGRIGKDYTEIDGATDHAVSRREAVAMLTWRNSAGVGSGSCELNNVVFNYASDDYDERATGLRPELDRGGPRERYGAEVTLYQREVMGLDAQDKPKPYSIDHHCTRRGPFFRYRPVEYRMWRAGYEHGRADTDGTEFDGEFDRLNFGGEWPISPPGTKAFWSIGAQADYIHVRYDNSSQSLSGVPRSDDVGYGEVVFRRVLSAWSKKRHVDAQIGISGTLDDNGDERLRVFAGLDFRFAPRSNRFLPEDGASQTIRPSGGAGSSSTEIQRRAP